jgi:hypothetical protein
MKADRRATRAEGMRRLMLCSPDRKWGEAKLNDARTFHGLLTEV